MRYPKGHKMHRCCPDEFKRTSDVTGSFELDAVIQKNPNRDMKARLDMFLDDEDNAYGPITGYSGYHGYSGDN